jgi:hypothetical protein
VLRIFGAAFCSGKVFIFSFFGKEFFSDAFSLQKGLYFLEVKNFLPMLFRSKRGLRFFGGKEFLTDAFSFPKNFHLFFKK